LPLFPPAPSRSRPRIWGENLVSGMDRRGPACSAWGLEPGASVSDAHGGGPWVGGVMRWQFASASQRTPPRHANAWQRPSICGGGAVGITSTHGIHHRRTSERVRSTSPMRSDWPAQVGSDNGL
jgi:hypothetical protein